MSKKTKKLFIESLTEEEKDIFLKNLSKQVQRLNKKLADIEELETKQKQGQQLQENQLTKLSGKQEHLSKKNYFNEVAELYVAAFKEQNISLAQLVALQNSDVSSSQQGATSTSQSSQQQQPLVQQQQQQTQIIEKIVQKIVEKEVFIDNPETETRILQQVLNLSHVAEYFRDEQSRQAATNYGVDARDVQVIYEFFRKVLLYSEGANFEKISSKRQIALEDLQRYLRRDEKVVLLNTSYRQIHDNVEKLANNQNFLQQSINIDSKQQNVIGSIGSEIKPRKESVSQQPQLVSNHHTTHQQQTQQPSSSSAQTQQQQPQQTQQQQTQVSSSETQETSQTQEPEKQKQSSGDQQDSNNNRRGGDDRPRKQNQGRYQKTNNNRGGPRKNNNEQSEQEPRQIIADDDWHEVGKKKPQTSGNFKPQSRGGDRPDRAGGDRRDNNRRNQRGTGDRSDNNKNSSDKQESSSSQQQQQQQYIKKESRPQNSQNTTNQSAQ